MSEVIAIAITLAVMAIITVVRIIRERKRRSLSKDDGFVWNTTIEKRLEEENKK